jgi:hypothetical protein
MLHCQKDTVRHYYRLAMAARERAMRQRDTKRKAEWLQVERRWITLAQRSELTENLATLAMRSATSWAGRHLCKDRVARGHGVQDQRLATAPIRGPVGG